MNKTDRVIHIYIRKNGFYFVPIGITGQGFPYQTPPFEYLPANAELPALWEATEKCFSNTNRVVPHPKTWDEMSEWYIHAGVKRWHDFASEAKAISIKDSGEQFDFAALHWDGSGFEGASKTKKTVHKSTGLEEKLSVLCETLARAREV